MAYKTKKKYNLEGGKNPFKKTNKEKKQESIINKEKKDKKKVGNKAAKQARKDAKADKNKAIANKKKEQTKKKLQSRKGQLMNMLTEDIEAKFGKEYREGQVDKSTKGPDAQGPEAKGPDAKGPDAKGEEAQGEEANDEDKNKGAKKSLIFLWAFVFGAIISFNLTKKEDRSTSSPF